MDDKEKERIEAVNRYIMGDKPSNSCRDADRSEKWFFTWVESKYLGVGADAIQYRMDKLVFSKDEIPLVSTIKRIVKTHGLKVNKLERYKRVKSKKQYTILNPAQIDGINQMDSVGPRFIKGYGAVSSLNLIDAVCNRVHIEQYDTKSRDNVIDFLIRYWRNNPIPRYLQVDNGMYFIGDFKYPRRSSRFIRFCLYVGVEVVFINPKSPWMNGSIENFNGWFEEKFWEKETFVSMEDMRAKSTHFVEQYNDLSAGKNRNKLYCQEMHLHSKGNFDRLFFGNG